jgi:hypothetical protein
MQKALFAAGFAAALVASTQLAIADRDDDRHDENIQVGPRPFYLVDGMDNSALKSKLLSCKDEPVHRTNFSIGHRGASLQFPEHTKESYQAAARMGAGIVECDVTFTGDGTLVCRHAQNDLATTTNILLTPLVSTCIKPFTPATRRQPQMDAATVFSCARVVRPFACPFGSIVVSIEAVSNRATNSAIVRFAHSRAAVVPDPTAHEMR